MDLQLSGNIFTNLTIEGVRAEPVGDFPNPVRKIAIARVRRLVFAAYDPKGGGVEHGPRVFSHATCHHKPEIVGGVQATRAETLLKDFFAARR